MPTTSRAARAAAESSPSANRDPMITWVQKDETTNKHQPLLIRAQHQRGPNNGILKAAVLNSSHQKELPPVQPQSAPSPWFHADKLAGCLSDRVFRAPNEVRSCCSSQTTFWGACPAVSSA
eukprot:2025375-Heterocapsa_arctica.AAC.1